MIKVMATFYICRHGETENNKNKRLSGWIDTPLTADGIKNSVIPASKLRGVAFDRVVSSDLGRAFNTAQLLVNHLDLAIPIETTKQLREMNYGDFGNMVYDPPDQRYPVLTPQQNTDYVPPNGESLAQMQARVLAYIDHLATDNPDKTILLVGHDGTINAVRAGFSGLPIGVVEVESNNPHSFTGKFTYENHRITSFQEVLGAQSR